jgi:hypothetical protein
MTMKKPVYLPLIVLFVFILGACTTVKPQPGTKMINPGDNVGDFLITTGNEGEVTYSWDLGCVKQGEGEEYSCKATAGKKVNISVGIYDDTFRGKLEEIWSGHTYELFIENRPVNLQAFGFIDFNHPKVGKMRAWNVVLFSNKPGEIVIRDSGVVHGDPFESTMTYTFTAP